MGQKQNLYELLQLSEYASADQIREAIRETTEKEPTGLEINQVAARLASVGWPLTDHG